MEFEVATIGEEFAVGLDVVYELQDFPYLGESVKIQWQQPMQNFSIIEHSE